MESRTEGSRHTLSVAWLGLAWLVFAGVPLSLSLSLSLSIYISLSSTSPPQKMNSSLKFNFKIIFELRIKFKHEFYHDNRYKFIFKFEFSFIRLSYNMFVCLFVSHLRPMGLNVLGYQSGLLQRCHPVCSREGFSHLSPVLALCIFFYRDASSALLQLVNQWLNFTCSRSHACRCGSQDTTSVFSRIELTASALLLAAARGYLLDHSGDKGQHVYKSNPG